MPARINKTRLNAEWRESIKTKVLLNRLQAFALDENDPSTKKPAKLSALQLRAIEILLRKTLPDLQAITLEGGEEGEGIKFQIVHTVRPEG